MWLLYDLYVHCFNYTTFVWLEWLTLPVDTLNGRFYLSPGRISNFFLLLFFGKNFKHLGSFSFRPPTGNFLTIFSNSTGDFTEDPVKFLNVFLVLFFLGGGEGGKLGCLDSICLSWWHRGIFQYFCRVYGWFHWRTDNSNFSGLFVIRKFWPFELQSGLRMT